MRGRKKVFYKKAALNFLLKLKRNPTTELQEYKGTELKVRYSAYFSIFISHAAPQWSSLA